MQVAVAGLWELGHNVPLSEADLWRYPLQDFGVAEWHMHPVTGIECEQVQEWGSFDAMLAHLRQSHELVWVTEAHADAVELQHFVHPPNACYIFGKANWSPFGTHAVLGDFVVRLGTRLNAGLLWPHQCLATVLWHRGLPWQ